MRNTIITCCVVINYWLEYIIKEYNKNIKNVNKNIIKIVFYI
jgi:hypothetical protein